MSRYFTALLAGLLAFGAVSTGFAEEDVVEESERVVDRDEIPDAVHMAHEKSDYGTWDIDEYAIVETENQGTLYEIEVEQTDGDKRVGLFYDEGGTRVATDESDDDED